ncbi:hypothetical protein ACFORL_01800 [Legionella dresdenensis]|uniref:SecA family profile domain-containing protein n=1 Tax=Legionella dresdenensis TaxID=450200 RepID=A0ABV8CC18_9GAMM
MTPEQIESLFGYYKSSIGEQNEPDKLDRVQFNLAIEFIEKNVDNELIALEPLASLSSRTRKLHEAQWELLKQILDKSLSAQQGYRFNQQLALKEIQNIRSLYAVNVSNRELHAVPNNLGIREKYKQQGNNLSRQEWLADKDFDDMLEVTGTKDKIVRSLLDKESLGTALHFQREKHKDQAQPYVIPLLLNNSAMGVTNDQGSHWISAIVTVDPVNHTVNYLLTDSMQIDKEQEEQYKQLMSEALKYSEQNSNGRSYDAFSNWTITGKVESGRQPDGYSCGYRALHNLFRKVDGLAANDIAREYRDLPSDSKALVNGFYKALLEDYVIPEADYAILSSNAAENFSALNNDGPVVQTERLVEFLENDSQIRVQSEPKLVHKLISACIGRLRGSDTVVIFPNNGNMPDSVSDVEYESFFSQLQKKLIEQERHLKQLKLSPCDKKLLNGLNAYCNKEEGLAIDELVVDIGANIDIHTLKMVLSGLSKNGLSKLVLVDKNGLLSEKDWKDLATFIIQEKNQVAIGRIDFPMPYFESNLQRSVDEAISSHLIARRGQELKGQSQQEIATEQTSPEPTESKPETKRTKRTRPKLQNTDAASIEIEIAQEQEVQVDVAVDTEIAQANGADADYSGVEGFGLTELISRVSRNELTLKPGAELLTESDIRKNWHRWHGDIVINNNANPRMDMLRSDEPLRGGEAVYKDPNAFFDKVTASAGAQLLNNANVFEYGLNPHRLAAGFVIIQNNEGGKTLHYDPTIDSVNDYLRPVIRADKEGGFSTFAFNTIKGKLKPDDGRDRQILQQWQKMVEGPYNREREAIFKKSLPGLLLLNEGQIRTLFTLATDEQGNLDSGLMDYMLANATRVKTLFKGNGPDEINSMAYTALLKKFQRLPPEALDNYIKFANELTENDPEQHILWQLLNDEQKTELAQWDKKLSFGNKQLNALLQVYSEYSADGLTQLFRQWKDIDPRLMKDLYPILFSKSDSFSDFIANDELSRAINLLKSLGNVEYSWFKMLLQQHAEVAGYEELPALLQSFTAFMSEINAYRLKIDTPPQFSGVKNMPTALARMLSIIAKTRSEDRPAQWQAISQLDLDSNAAPRAFAERDASFVVPEMKTSALHCDPQDRYKLAYGAVSPEVRWKIIATPFVSLEKTRENYYRYLAHQPDRLPLAFYQSIEQTIASKNWTDAEKAMVMSILVQATVGSNVDQMDVNNLPALEQQCQQIINTLDKLPLPSVLKVARGKVREQIIVTLFSLNQIPSLTSLDQLVKLCSKAVANAWGIKANAEMLARKCNILDMMTVHPLDQAIYQGMTFYREQDYTSGKESLFYRHLDISAILLTGHDGDYIYGHPIEVDNDSSVDRGKWRAGGLLISLISTFGLTSEPKALSIQNAEKIHKAFEEASNKYGSHFHRAIEILQKIKHRGEPPLSAKELREFIEKYEALEKPEQVVESWFKDYFPEKFFEQYRSQGIPSEVNALLNGRDPEEKSLIIGILTNFTAAGSADSYLPVTKSLLAIIDKMPFKERMVFLTRISSPDLINDAGIDKFQELLAVIRQHNLIDEFMFFAEKAQQFEPKPVTGLLEKTLLYLNRLSPAINKLVQSPNEDARVEKAVTKMDLINPVIDLLLISEKNSLNADTGITQQGEIKYNPLLEVIARAGKIPNKELEQQLTEALSALPDNGNDLTMTMHLKNHLHDINNPKPVAPPERGVLEKAVEVVVNTVSSVASTFANGVKNFFGFGAKNTEQPPAPAIPAEPVTAVAAEPVVAAGSASLIDDKLIRAAIAEIDDIKRQYRQYDRVFVALFETIQRTAEHYKGDKKIIINFLRPFLKKDFQGNAVHFDKIVLAWNNVNLLSNAFITIDNADMVRSLCTHFNKEAGEYTPTSLLKLLTHPDYTAHEKSEQVLFLNILTSLINNGKPCTMAELTQLMHVSKDDKELVDVLKAIYQSAPYPSLSQFNAWLEAYAAEPEQKPKSVYLLERYQQFDKQPCPREENNGFNPDYAASQAKKMTGIHYTPEKIAELDNEIKAVKELGSAAIRQELEQSRQGLLQPPLSNARLTALVAELLYRTKGKEGGNGNSFEIHTTQYLAIHSALESGQHVTSEIGTGEGKSRIMMLLVACQYARGKTVDFVTKDVQLALREYLEFKPFFQAMGAETNLIYQYTPASEYKIGGINFSDAHNLSLCRNKAASEGKGHLVRHPDKTKCALMLDEADSVYFDCANLRYNYSALADDSIRGMPWIYDVMLDFFSDPEMKQERIEAYYNDIDWCNTLLKDYIEIKKGKPGTEKLKGVSDAQLEIWQDSAVTALSLTFKKDFVLSSNIEIQTSTGPKIVSQAHLITKNEANPHARFSLGVHQCLEALLNKRKKELEGKEPETEFEYELAKCAHDFYVDDEKQIVYSTMSKALLDDYDQGMLCAVTGTAGSIKEQQEASMMYGAGNNAPMQFITVPRHKGLNREDLPLYLAEKPRAKLALLIKEIKQARKYNQPVLLICENDVEATTLFEQLKAAFPDDPLLTQIHAKTEQSVEADHIKHRAGLPGMVTVSTGGKMGRGTDIPLHGEADRRGLRVRATFLPSEREMYQIFGRAGRFGKNGDAGIVVAKRELKEKLGKKTLTDGFYTASTAYIRQQQAIMDRKSQVERLIKFTAADYMKRYTDNFFNDFFPKVDANQRKAVNGTWAKFIGAANLKWNEAWRKIGSEMDKVDPDLDKIKNHFAEYESYVTERWAELKAELNAGPSKEQAAVIQPNPAGKLEFSAQAEKLLTGFDVKKIIALKTPVTPKYYPAYDGKAVLYPSFGASFKAWFQKPLFADFRAWVAGRGILFPNLRAWSSGAMTFGEFITGVSRARSEPVQEAPAQKTPSEIVKVEDDTVHESYAIVGKKTGLTLETAHQPTAAQPVEPAKSVKIWASKPPQSGDMEELTDEPAAKTGNRTH